MARRPEKQYLALFELPPRGRVKALSRGMRTKLALLLAFCRGADLLILDEPTSGLDPASTEEVLQAIVGHVAGEEITVFFSSHQLSEVDQIADHVAIIHRGRTVVPVRSTICASNYRRIQLVFDGDAPDAAFRAPGVERVAQRRAGADRAVRAPEPTRSSTKRARSTRCPSMYAVTLKDMFLETVAAED